MALWPNNRRDILGAFPCSGGGSLAFSQNLQRTQRSLALFANGQISPASSVPEGSFESRSCLIAPITSGGMSSAGASNGVTFSASGSAISGGLMSGSAGLSATADASMSLIVSLSGEALASVSCDGISLALTISLSGEASWQMTADGANLGLIVPMSGSAFVVATGTADLKGLLSLSGESSPFAELSPQNIAAAVWSSVAASNDEAGSMGEKMNDAGGAANPWNEVIESGFTAAEILRLLASVMAAKSAGGGTTSVTFRDLADTKNRITATVDENGNRSAVVADAT